MKYSIYYYKTDSDDNHTTGVKGWYNTLKESQADLNVLVDELCDDMSDITLIADHAGNKPQPTTDRVLFSICLISRN